MCKCCSNWFVWLFGPDLCCGSSDHHLTRFGHDHGSWHKVVLEVTRVKGWNSTTHESWTCVKTILLVKSCLKLVDLRIYKRYFQRTKYKRNHVFLKTDLTLTRMIFRTHKCVNTCVTRSFGKISIFVKFTRRCKDGISLKTGFLLNRIALYKDPLNIMGLNSYFWVNHKFMKFIWFT